MLIDLAPNKCGADEGQKRKLRWLFLMENVYAENIF